MADSPKHGHSQRYSRYTGGPDPLAPPVDLREALEQIGQDVMEGSSPRRALQELLRRGTQNMRGADRLAAEANRRRRELLQRNNLDGTLQEVKKLLDEAVLAERKELARALDDDARFNDMRIESLPPSPAKAVQELSDYDWRSQEVREKYAQIKDLLGRERLDAHLQSARPGEDWTGSSRFSGDNPRGMGEGTQALADIAELEQLAEALSQSYAGATMDDIDLD